MSAGFVAHVTELLHGLGHIEARPMFGGHGIYSDGAFIAIVLDDVLYLKADAQNRDRFVRAGLKPFVYRNRPSVSYYRAPADALESPEAALSWAREALGAALRSRSVSAKGSSRPRRRARSRATSRPARRGRRRTGKA